MKFVSKNNPLLLIYYDDEETQKTQDEQKAEEKIGTCVPFSDKYLEKFKNFPNNYVFTELELEQQRKTYEELKLNHEKMKTFRLNELREELATINEIWQKVGDGVKFESTFENKKMLLQFSCIEGDYEYYDDNGNEVTCYSEETMNSDNFDELYQTIIDKKANLEKEMREVSEKVFSEEELRLEATEVVINHKLDGYINNYVLEHTPLGNIYMRYNNDKKSFEYFSNSTIPYRFLEPVGRKYVMTYWCKPLFVDAEEELKNAEIRLDEAKKQKEEEDRRVREESKNKPRMVMAQLKDYNKETKTQKNGNRPMKNRVSNDVITSQMKANLVDINQRSEKQLLKERANRYTWEGRLTNFSPLKKIDKKIVCKNLALTYADFKRMKQEEKSKENKK